MAQPDLRLKKLKIQTGVVKRLTKDRVMYDKEIAETHQKIEKLRKEGRSLFIINQQEEVLEESQKMIPTVLGKLKDACEELEGLLREVKVALSDSEEYKTAQSVVDAAKAMLEPADGENVQHDSTP